MKDCKSHPHVLLVEGSEDAYFVLRLKERSGLPVDICIANKRGRVPLLQSITTEADAPGRTILGIVLDADNDPTACWREVTQELDELRQMEHFCLPDLPDQPQASGTIVEGSVRIGIWLMPDNQSPGELENLVAKMIPRDDLIWPLSEQYIDEISEEQRVHKPEKDLKAKVHAWLATREEPRAIGLAVEAGDLNTRVANATSFVDWLRELFEDSS